MEEKKTERIDTGGAAFPRTGYYPPTSPGMDIEHLRELLPTTTEPEQGMSLRDYFAAHVSDSVVAGFVRKYMEVLETNEPEKWRQPAYSEWHCNTLARIEARYRLAVADAMLAARNGGPR